MKYSPQLNIRSAYNFQESLITINDYLDFALNNNFKYAFYNDLNSMFGAAEFYDKFNNKNIKPIIGLAVEFELNQNISLLIYAKNRKGYLNLTSISSELMSKDMDTSEKMNFIRSHVSNDNIFVISFETKIDNDFIDNFFLEIEKENIYFGTDKNNSLNVENDKLIFVNKISYIEESDIKNYNVLLAIKNGEVFNNENLIDNHYPNDDDLYKVIEQSNKNIEKIVSQIDFNLFGENKIHFMEYKTPDNIPQRSFLRELTKQSLQSYFKIYNIPESMYEKYIDRLKYELDIIESMDFVNYFLIVWDYVQYAKKNKIMVGPGRGSAAGSLVSFLLRITTVDPLQYDLLFERFLNPERQTMPDIDIDFQDTRRDEVIEYLFEKYGLTNVATIVTFQTIAAKSAIRDVVRAYGKEVDLANKITKLIRGDGKDEMKNIIASSKLLQTYYESNKEIFDTASRIMGLPRQTGTHAAGIVLSDVDLREILPIKVGYNGIWQTQFPMEYLERLGLIKMDLLGLKNLTTLQDIKKMILRSRKQDVALGKINLNDNKVYETLNQGKTTGIFQLEGEGMTKLLKQMKVKNIEDISATSAIFRPGPKEMIPEYIKRRNSKKPVESYIIDPSLVDILGVTKGIILYQEQVIQILQKVGNFSLGKADIIRRAMSKKNHEYMNSMKSEFLKGALSNGYSESKANEIWEWIDNFASYGFNKSHSIAYSYISYWLAYLKTYFPEEFYSSLFNSSLGNSTKMNSYINEVNNYGIEFKSPSIKVVNNEFVSYNKMIFPPLTIIKGIGPEFVKKIRELYEEDKYAFDDMFVLASRLINKGLNKTTLEAMIWSGAFDTYGYDRKTLSDNIDTIINFADANSTSTKIDPITIPLLQETTKATDEMIYQNEFEYLGFYLSKNPFSQLRKEYSQNNVSSLSAIRDKFKYGNTIFIVNQIRTKKDKNNKLMAFVEIQDDTATIRGTIFSSTFELIKDDFKEGRIVLANIKINSFNGQDSAIVEQIIKYIK